MGKHPINLSGRIIGSSVVIKRIGTRGLKPVWECKCICGNTFNRVTQTLLDKTIKNINCGCLGRGPSVDPEESGFNCVIGIYKSNARNKNQNWNLNKNEAKHLFLSNCYYCGIEPKNIMTHKNSYAYFKYNGIDRKDNNIGYELNNCVACCSDCNFLKKDRNFDEFISKIKLIAKNFT